MKNFSFSVVIGLAFMVFPVSASAQVAQDKPRTQEGKERGFDCPFAFSPAAICSSVSGRIKDKDQSGLYEYLYQRQVYEASCVDPDTDDEATVEKKVGEFWDSNSARLVCDSTQFNVPNGSVLKFAVAKVFSDFIADAIQIWRIDLNHVDASDGRTVLDYVDAELARQKGSPNEPTLRHYRNELHKAGAKRAAELSGSQ